MDSAHNIESIPTVYYTLISAVSEMLLGALIMLELYEFGKMPNYMGFSSFQMNYTSSMLQFPNFQSSKFTF